MKPILPTRFFVTGGTALSRISKLNAFDLALMKAGIAQCNLVPVTSIIPKGAVEAEPCTITPGSITFVVMAHIEGEGEEKIGAGIAWSFIEGEDYGLVAETHGNTDREELRRNLKARIEEMARIRNVKLRSIEYRIETLQVPKGFYGSALAALVFIPENR